MRPPPSKLTGLTCAENGEILLEKLKSLAAQIMDISCDGSSEDSPGQSNQQCSDEGPSQVKMLLALF